MRKLALVLIASLVVAFVPTAASAQKISLQDILRVTQGASAFGYNSCSYVNGGFGQAACQVNRATTVANTLADAQRDRANRKRDAFNKRQDQLNALQRACKAGDAQSCARSGGADSKQMEVARALMDACTAGDRSSCDRATAMMDERNITASYQQQQAPRYVQQGYAPQQVAQNSRQQCLPVYDRNTGYRIAGVCR